MSVLLCSNAVSDPAGGFRISFEGACHRCTSRHVVTSAGVMGCGLDIPLPCVNVDVSLSALLETVRTCGRYFASSTSPFLAYDN